MDILYKDNDIFVGIKPSGISSADEPGGMPDLIRKELGNPTLPVKVVHRLDQPVAGVMVYALSDRAAAALSRAITEKTFRKEYLAVVEGTPEPTAGRMDDLLFRDAAKNRTYLVKRMRKGVREASLLYETLECRDGLSLVKIELLTGRTHQIRAQFSGRKMPLTGDRKYGSQRFQDGDRPALWSYRISFPHPVTGENMTFSKEPPDAAPWNLFDKLMVLH